MAVDNQPRSVTRADQPKRAPSGPGDRPVGQPNARMARSLAVALLGSFVVTLDALAVNVALPTIGHDLGAGITGLQWVVDGYTLMFAALMLSAGAIADRIGARQAYGAELVLFVAALAAERRHSV